MYREIFIRWYDLVILFITRPFGFTIKVLQEKTI